LYPRLRKKTAARPDRGSAVIRGLAVSADGKWLVSGGVDRSVIIWDLEKKKLKAVIDGFKNDVTSVAISPDGKTIAAPRDSRLNTSATCASCRSGCGLRIS
jgi:WD40 repeat protein